MPIPRTTWKFENDKLQAAINERIKFQGRTTRTFAQMVNTALWSVALKAQQHTPAASISDIDKGMHVEIEYRKNRKGETVPERKGKKFKYNPSTHPNLHGEQAEIAMMFAVVLARANLSKQGRLGNSWYNQNTNDRWKLDKSILHTKAIIWDIAERMVSARHSSTSMLKAGWKPAMDILRPYIASNDVGGSAKGEQFDYRRKGPPMGTAIPAKEGWVCWGRIENNIGEGGTALDGRQRAALLKFGAEPLARALEEERDEMLLRIKGWAEKDGREFNAKMQ